MRQFDSVADAVDFLFMSVKHTSPDQDAAFEYISDHLRDYIVTREDDRIEVHLETVKIGECEAYEVDALCKMIEVKYQEIEK